jgi:hypothetical protein
VHGALALTDQREVRASIRAMEVLAKRRRLTPDVMLEQQDKYWDAVKAME